ncbi:ankyrin repeat protein, partial [Biomphalaria glabrata]
MGNNCCKRSSSVDIDDEPLIRAVRGGCLKTVQKVLSTKDYGTVTNALVEAASFTNITILEFLAKRADVNLVNAKGQTALLEAVTSGNRNSVQRLLDVGASPNVCHRDTGDSPLILATKLGFTEIISSLLKGKAHVDYLNSISDLSALMEACQSGKEDIVNILIQAGKCNVELLNQKFENALMLACFSGHMGIVQSLIRFRCRLDCVNIDGENALMKAEGQGHKNIVEFLVEQGAYGGAANNESFTAIEQYLVEKRSTSSCKVSTRAKVTGALIGGPAEVDVVRDSKDGELKERTLRREPAHDVTNGDFKVIKDNIIKIIDVIPASGAKDIINSDSCNVLSTNIPDDSSNNCDTLTPSSHVPNKSSNNCDTLTLSSHVPNKSSNKCEGNISDSCDILTTCSEYKDSNCNSLEISTYNSQSALTSHYKQTPICDTIDKSTVSFTQCDADKNCVPDTNAVSTIDTSSIIKRDSVSSETASSGFCETTSRDFCETPSNGLYETATWCKTPDLCTSPEQSSTDMSTFSEFSTPNTTTDSSSPRLACDPNASLHQENEISSQALTNEETNTNPSCDESKPCLKGNCSR